MPRPMYFFAIETTEPIAAAQDLARELLARMADRLAHTGRT